MQRQNVLALRLGPNRRLGSKSFGEQERWEYTISESFGKNSQTTRSEALVKREVVCLQKSKSSRLAIGTKASTVTPLPLIWARFQTYMSPSYSITLRPRVIVLLGDHPQAEGTT